MIGPKLSTSENTPEVKWHIGPRGPKLAARSIYDTEVVIPKDPEVPFWREVPKDRHPHRAIVAAPAQSLEAIKKYYGNDFLPAVHLSVRVLGALPLKMIGVFEAGDFSHLERGDEDYNAVALRHGPHDFTARMGLLNPITNTFHIAEGIVTVAEFQSEQAVAERNIVSI